MTKDRGKRIMQSDRARRKRRTVKEIKRTLLKRYYAHMKHLRQKYNKLKRRHHDTANLD